MTDRALNTYWRSARSAALLVGSQLLEQQEEWQLERRRFFSEATMAKIPEPEEDLELADGEGADEEPGTLS